MEPTILSSPDSDRAAPRGERRRSVRQKLHTPVYVSFNGPESGMVVDLSELLDLHEHGFAVQTAIPTGLQRSERLEVNRAVTLCLELPETRKYLHGSGQVMWTDDTGRAGIRFSFLPEGSRQILKEWLFANLLVAFTNHAARSEQVAHHKREESPRRELPASALPALGLPAPDSTVAEKTPVLAPVLTPTASTGAVVAPPERADLLSALDDVGREVRKIEARDVGDSSDIDPVLQFITGCALSLTGATGAALALRTGGRMLCRARSGDPAPPVGSEVDVKAGLSGTCVRNGILVTCEDPETDFRVDPKICRNLGIGSFVAAPVFNDSRVVGLLEIFSFHPRSFTKIHGTILERLAELVPRIEEKPEPKTIEPVHIEEKKTLLTNAELKTANLTPARLAEETQPAPGTNVPRADYETKYETPDLQRSDDARARKTARRPYFIHIGLMLLVPGTLAMVLGYLLAPTIQKRWMGQTQAAKNSQQSSGQASQQAPSNGPMTSSSYSLPNATDRRGHNLSPEDLRKLGEQGDAESQYQLGILYHDGSTVPKDDAQAVQWFRRAAEQGYVRAQSTLGAYYWAGRGVPQDYTQAYFWSQLALAQGDENSKSRLEGLSAQMTHSQVANARQLAETWLHAHTQATKPSPGSK